MTTERLHWRNDIDYLEKRLALAQAEVAAQKLHMEHLESCLTNLNRERIDEAAKLRDEIGVLQSRLVNWQKIADGVEVANLKDEAAKLQARLTKAEELLTRSRGINVTNGPVWRNERDAFLAKHTE